MTTDILSDRLVRRLSPRGRRIFTTNVDLAWQQLHLLLGEKTLCGEDLAGREIQDFSIAHLQMLHDYEVCPACLEAGRAL